MSERQMLRWLCRVMRKDEIRKAYVRGFPKITSVVDELDGRRLQWYDHVRRWDEKHMVKRAMELELEGARREGD